MEQRKKTKRKIIRDPKVRGEWVESLFMARASEQGLAVSKPWGDSNTFDFVVGRPGRFVSVQVKSTMAESGGGYACAVKKQGEVYARGSFDFLAAYVIPEDVWYIIPAEKVEGKASVGLCSDSTTAKYEEYREAWHRLREAGGTEELKDPVLEKAASSGPAAEPGDSAQSESGGTVAQGTPMGPGVARMQNAFNFIRRQMERGGRTPGA